MNAASTLLASALVLLPLTTSAADLPVSYLVEEKPLKAAVLGTSLTFGLYRDNACTTLIQSVPVNVENITILSKLKQMTPKNDTKQPNTVELRTSLSGVTAAGNVYLKVSGTGIATVGAACQAQSAQVAASPPVGFVDAAGVPVGPVVTSAIGCGYLALVRTPYGAFAGTVGPSGLFESQCANGAYFTSSDCTGTPLVTPPYVESGLVLTAGAGATLFPAPDTGYAPTAPQSALYSSQSAATCTGAGHTFIPPAQQCCCATSACSLGEMHLAPALASIVFTPPLTMQ